MDDYIVTIAMDSGGKSTFTVRAHVWGALADGVAVEECWLQLRSGELQPFDFYSLSSIERLTAYAEVRRQENGRCSECGSLDGMTMGCTCDL